MQELTICLSQPFAISTMVSIVEIAMEIFVFTFLCHPPVLDVYIHYVLLH